MYRLPLCTAGLVLLLTAFTTGQAPKPEPEPLVEQVRKAIDNGKKFLYGQQRADGDWEVDAMSRTRSGGYSSLAVLALLNAGDKPDHPVVQKGLAYLRTLEPRHTYVVGLQTMALAEAGDPKDLPLIQRNVNWLVANRVFRANQLIGWGYMANSPGTDNSNTQYALLGLWAGKTAGADIKRDVWESIQEYYLRNQTTNGGWLYLPINQNIDRTAKLTMTTAGLCGLLIAGLELNAGEEKLDLQTGIAQNCGIYKENEAVAKAMSWIGKSFNIERGDAQLSPAIVLDEPDPFKA